MRLRYEGMNKNVLPIHDCNDTKSYWERYMYNPKMIDKQPPDMPINQCMSANDKILPYTKVREKITYNYVHHDQQNSTSKMRIIFRKRAI